MNEEGAHRWQELTSDMNLDGQFSVTDVWLWLQHLFFVPGDLLIASLLQHVRPLADFLELDPTNYGGLLSGVISGAAWLSVGLAIIYVLSIVSNADRALTAWVGRSYAEGLRRLRILKIRLATFNKGRGKLPAATAEHALPEVTFIELDEMEVAVLRCHLNIESFQVLTARETAEVLNVPNRQVQEALESLLHLRLLERALGTNEGEEGYRLSPTGKAYLKKRHHPYAIRTTG